MGTGASGGTFGTGIGFECNGLFSPVSDFIWNGLSMIIPEKHDHVESSQSSEGHPVVLRSMRSVPRCPNFFATFLL
jgi:hypothetical protein